MSLAVIALVKRLRDAGTPPWVAFIFLFALVAVPVIGLIFFWGVWPLAVLGSIGLPTLTNNSKSIDRDERAAGGLNDAG